jgi:hypothetical protein
MMKAQIDTMECLRQAGRPCALLLLLALAWTGPATAAEIYTWTDENGIVHYSDSPRASGEMKALEVEEIYRPGSTDAYATPADPTPSESAPAAGAESGSASAAQQRRDQIAKERAERRAKQAETDKLCARHRQRLEQMEPARRVLYTDEQGETVRMDDDQRIAMIDESKAFLRENCSG